MKRLIVATHSKGKFPEIVSKLGDVPFEIVNLLGAGFAPDFEVEEPGMTFEGNAIIKAMTFGMLTGEMTLADDSGIEVDALNGRPGVYSARYAPGTDEDRYRKLLGEMEDVPEEKRGAQFHCVIAIFDPKTKKIRTCEGICRGKILREPRGDHGFGYDPVFFHEATGKTTAEMTVEEKNAVSHRGNALKLAREVLLKEFVD